MLIFVQILLLIVGFAILIKGADYLVYGASNLALNFKVPKILIGLTVVAFGTSAPELAVSIKALSSGHSDMVLGNVIGSNIMNILLILGVAAAIHTIKMRRRTIRKELPICLLISVLLVVLMLDKPLAGAETNFFTRADGITVVLFFTVFLYNLIRSAFRKHKKQEEKPDYGVMKAIFLIIVGLVGVVLGSNMVVDAAKIIAQVMGVSERVISLTIIAFGTSLPELVTTIVAAKKGEQDLLVGNIIGSNIFNIAVVLGVPSIIFGGVDVASVSRMDMIAFVVAAGVLMGFALHRKELDRKEGVLMLLIFATYYSSVALA